MFLSNRRRIVKLENPWLLQPKFNQKRTDIEMRLANELRRRGEKYIEQFRIGRYIVDFYLPDRKLVIEADGEYWHSSAKAQAHDARRDKSILTTCEVKGWPVTIVHIPGEQLKAAHLSKSVENALRKGLHD